MMKSSKLYFEYQYVLAVHCNLIFVAVNDVTQVVNEILEEFVINLMGNINYSKSALKTLINKVITLMGILISVTVLYVLQI